MRSAITLGIVAALCATSLAALHAWTAPTIQAARDAERFAALRTLTTIESGWEYVSEDRTFQHPEHPNLRVVLRVAQGYGGEIEAAIALQQSEVLDVLVVHHQETPGIGDFIEGDRSVWLHQFRGYTEEAASHVDGRSGATITADAMIQLVRDAARQNATSRAAL